MGETLLQLIRVHSTHCLSDVCVNSVVLTSTEPNVHTLWMSNGVFLTILSDKGNCAKKALRANLFMRGLKGGVFILVEWHAIQMYDHIANSLKQDQFWFNRYESGWRWGRVRFVRWGLKCWHPIIHLPHFFAAPTKRWKVSERVSLC